VGQAVDLGERRARAIEPDTALIGSDVAAQGDRERGPAQNLPGSTGQRRPRQLRDGSVHVQGAGFRLEGAGVVESPSGADGDAAAAGSPFEQTCIIDRAYVSGKNIGKASCPLHIKYASAVDLQCRGVAGARVKRAT